MFAKNKSLTLGIDATPIPTVTVGDDVDYCGGAYKIFSICNDKVELGANGKSFKVIPITSLDFIGRSHNIENAMWHVVFDPPLDCGSLVRRVIQRIF